MDLFRYLMAKNGHNYLKDDDLFSYNLAKGQGGTYAIFEGTTINADNTRRGKMKLSLKGNTSQETTTGKNLLPNDATSTTISGVTYTINSDKTIKVNGTATADSVLYLNSSSVTIPAGTKTLNGCPSGGSWGTYSMAFGGYNDSGSGNTFTLNADYSNRGYIRIANGYTANNLLFKPMISTSGGDYEPYTNGASPNPDYPQDVHVVTGDNIITIENSDSSESQSYHITLPEGTELCKIGTYQDKFIRNSGKQLLNPSLIDEYTTSTGITISHNSSGEIVLNGTASAQTNLNTPKLEIPTGTTQVSISGGTSSVSYAYITYTSDDTYIGASRDSGTPQTYTIPSNASKYEMNIRIASGTTLNNYVVRAMFNNGSTPLPYEPYGNGDWYLEKKIGKYTFTGNETPNSITGGYFYYDSSLGGMSYLIGGFNTKFQFINDDRINNNTSANEYLSDNQMAFRLGNYTKDRLYIKTQLSESDLKSTLANTPLYYVLNTPTYTKIEGTLKDELEALQNSRSYDGQTNINQSNNDLASNMEAQILVNE